MPERPREPPEDESPDPLPDDAEPLPRFDLMTLPVETTKMPIRARMDTAPAAAVPGLST